MIEKIRRLEKKYNPRKPLNVIIVEKIDEKYYDNQNCVICPQTVKDLQQKDENLVIVIEYGKQNTTETQ